MDETIEYWQEKLSEYQEALELYDSDDDQLDLFFRIYLKDNILICRQMIEVLGE